MNKYKVTLIREVEIEVSAHDMDEAENCAFEMCENVDFFTKPYFDEIIVEEIK